MMHWTQLLKHCERFSSNARTNDTKNITAFLCCLFQSSFSAGITVVDNEDENCLALRNMQLFLSTDNLMDDTQNDNLCIQSATASERNC